MARIKDLYPGSSHVSSENLLAAPDVKIWNFGKSHEFAIVTADGDFYELAVTLGPPPKVIWLRGCDYPTDVAEHLLRDEAIRIAEFLNEQDHAVLILRP